MKVFGISISYEEIEIDNEKDYRGAVTDGAVGDYLDPQLSDLRGGGTVIVDAGHVIDPYGHGNDDLLELLAPVLARVPLSEVQDWFMRHSKEINNGHYGVTAEHDSSDRVDSKDATVLPSTHDADQSD